MCVCVCVCRQAMTYWNRNAIVGLDKLMGLCVMWTVIVLAGHLDPVTVHTVHKSIAFITAEYFIFVSNDLWAELVYIIQSCREVICAMLQKWICDDWSKEVIQSFPQCFALWHICYENQNVLGLEICQVCCYIFEKALVIASRFVVALNLINTFKFLMWCCMLCEVDQFFCCCWSFWVCSHSCILLHHVVASNSTGLHYSNTLKMLIWCCM